MSLLLSAVGGQLRLDAHSKAATSPVGYLDCRAVRRACADPLGPTCTHFGIGRCRTCAGSWATLTRVCARAPLVTERADGERGRSARLRDGRGGWRGRGERRGRAFEARTRCRRPQPVIRPSDARGCTWLCSGLAPPPKLPEEWAGLSRQPRRPALVCGAHARARRNAENADPTAPVHMAYLCQLYTSPRHSDVPADMRGEHSCSW